MVKLSPDHGAEPAQPRAWQLALLCLAYVAAGKLGLGMAFLHPSATPFWPPTGIALAGLLLLGRRAWPAVFVGAFVVNITTAGGWLTCLGISAGNTLEAVLGAHLVNRFAGGRRFFDRLADVFRFALLAAVASTTVSATIGVACLLQGGLVSGSVLGTAWLTWWLGDAVGALKVAPLILAWLDGQAPAWSRARLVEGALLAAVVGLVSAVVFGGWLPGGSTDYPLEFLCLLPLLWAAFRFQQRGAVLASVLMSGIAIAGTLHGLGPFARTSANESLLLLQAFVGVAALTALALAAVVAERERLNAQLAYLADHDHLTGVLNRQRFEAGLARELALSRRYGSHGALLFLDLDDFKRVNDELGHPAGDALLSRFTRLLEARLRKSDLLARYGGDEFAILVPHADTSQAQALAGQLLSAIAQQADLLPSPGPKITASVGVVLFPEHGMQADELLAHADAAMYRAKQSGGNRFCLHAGDARGTRTNQPRAADVGPHPKPAVAGPESG